MDELCRQGAEYYLFVTNLLEKWVRSGNPDYMWAAGASVWRIYDGLWRAARSSGDGETTQVQKAQEALAIIWEILKKLASTFNHFNKEVLKKALTQALHIEDPSHTIDRDHSSVEKVTVNMREQFETFAANNLSSILHAIRQMAWMNAADVVGHIITWLKDYKDSNLYFVGQLAASQLFRENASSDMQLLNERHGPLLDLIGPLLSTVDQNLVNTMLNTLLIWLQQPGWAKKIYSALLWVANRVTPKEADVLNAGLAEYWLDSAVPEARCLGLRLIARMYTLQGAPLDMPGQRYAVVALDASRKGRSSHVAESGQGIYVHYAGRVDTYMFSMGQRKPTACPGQIPTTAQLRPLFNLPRLLAGALEGLGNCAPSHMHFLLAWTSENILDADDLDEVVFHDRIIIASPDEKAVRWRNDLDFVRVNRNPSSQDFLMV